MRNLNIALRSLFKKERHNMTKILSLGIGLAVALVLIAKICFERSFDSFYPDVERVYRLVEYGSMNGGDPFEFSQTPGAVAPAMKEEVPGIEGRYASDLRNRKGNPDHGRRQAALLGR